MKKALLILAGLIMAASSAYASKARMGALGQSTTYGSQYLLDSKNIFHNPAYLHELGGYFQLEFGDAGTREGNGDPATTTGNPLGQGGFFKKSSNATWGIWLGGDSETGGAYREGLMSSAGLSTVPNPDNQVEFFYAGGGAMKWGASFWISSNTDDDKSAYTTTTNTGNGITANSATDSSMGVRAGVNTDKWNVGLVLSLASTGSVKATGTGYTDQEHKFEGTSGILLTAGYDMKGYDLYFAYGSNGGKASGNNGADVEVERADTTMTLGVAKKYMMDKNHMFWSVAYSSEVQDTKDVSTTTNTALPVVVGVEVEATDWLAVRGSVTQNLFLMNSTTTEPNGGDAATAFQRDTNNVAAGGTIKWDKVYFDGLFGWADDTANFGTDDIFSYVSMTYKF